MAAHNEFLDVKAVHSLFIQPVGHFSGEIDVDGRIDVLDRVPGVVEDSGHPLVGAADHPAGVGRPVKASVMWQTVPDHPLSRRSGPSQGPIMVSPVTQLKLAVIAGDGIGTEVVAEGLKVLDAVAPSTGLTVSTTDYDLGARRYNATGESYRVRAGRVARART